MTGGGDTTDKYNFCRNFCSRVVKARNEEEKEMILVSETYTQINGVCFKWQWLSNCETVSLSL
jgi:ABC-type polysaccharide/polyol phosphate transport system ATPase subunit